MKTLLMFSGQGSHFPGMGFPLLDREPAFRRRVEALCALAGGGLDVALLRPVKKRSDAWIELRQTHPLLYILQASFGLWWRERGLPVDAVLGYSLGELAAAAVAGMISAEDGLQVALRQGELAWQLCPRSLMVAVLADAAGLARMAGFYGKEPVGVHFPGNSVWVFTEEEWGPAEAALKAHGISHQVLPVERPFHTGAMAAMREAMLMELGWIEMNQPEIPVFSSTRGSFLEAGVGAAHFQELLEVPVHFIPALRRLEAEGPWRYVDGGPSGTLANFVRYNLGGDSQSTVRACFSPLGKGVGGEGELRRWFD